MPFPLVLINTVVARGISGFLTCWTCTKRRHYWAATWRLGLLADAAVFVASDLASGITGEVIHVDTGYHIGSVN